MTKFSQSITFSKDNFNSIDTIKKINYNHSVLAETNYGPQLIKIKLMIYL